MKTKNFKKYLETRLNKQEIAEIEKQARREIKIIKSLTRTLREPQGERLTRSC